MAKIGYARVSTDKQTLDMQIAALEAAGCDRIYKEHASGADRDRQRLEQALSGLKEGDSLVVWKLDRLGRSVSHLVAIADDFRKRGIDLVSLTEGIDTRTPAGKMIFHVIAAMAEMERDLASERVKSGMQIAAKAGRHMGRPPKITPAKAAAARTLLESGQTLSSIAQALDLSLSSVKRALAANFETTQTPVTQGVEAHG